MSAVRETKQSHERFMTAILASDVFPSLEQKNPLDSSEVDELPARFGPNWYQHEREERKKDEEDVLEQDDRDIADLDSHLDQQKRLLFTETKIKAAPTTFEEDRPEIEDEGYDV